ncbi:MAG: succinylglutamate desuccinylase/aspartoacylase family protein, partial [Anaerolineae bacterium]
MGPLWDSDQVTQLHISKLDPFAVRAAGRQRLRLVVRQLSDGSFVTMPAAVLSDGRDSPRMVLVAGQHGDEWNGPWILHRLANLLNPDEVHGTLVILPITNPLAFNEGRRVSAVDSIDLNRSYSGGRPRKPTEHLGALLWKSVFSRTDYLIDLHSGGPGEYLPFAASPNGKDLDLARALNLRFIHLPGPTKAGLLVNTCQQAGVRAVLVEVG